MHKEKAGPVLTLPLGDRPRRMKPPAEKEKKREKKQFVSTAGKRKEHDARGG